MRYILPIIILAFLLFGSCRRTQVPTPEVNVVQAKEITLDPNAAVWDAVSLHVSKMILQDLVEPRLLEPSTPEVQVKAITNGAEIAFRLEWIDETQNDLPEPNHFIDGCAVQLPAKIETNVPAPQMGEVGKTVEISYWRADWQAIIEGRADNILVANRDDITDGGESGFAACTQEDDEQRLGDDRAGGNLDDGAVGHERRVQRNRRVFAGASCAGEAARNGVWRRSKRAGQRLDLKCGRAFKIGQVGTAAAVDERDAVRIDVR